VDISQEDKDGGVVAYPSDKTTYEDANGGIRIK
jgi:hypothetical protein